MSATDNSTLEFLLTHEFQQAYHTWDAMQRARDGLHASSVLESDSDFCTRQHVLADAFPGERQTKEQYWSVLAKFLHGWNIHEKWQQKLLKPSGLVVKRAREDDEEGWPLPPEWELDLTHTDPETGIKYSPDAIITFAGMVMPVEIKGINTLDFQGCEELYREVCTPVGAHDPGAMGYHFEKAQEKRPGIIGATVQEAMERNKSIRSAYPQVQLYMHLLGLQKGVILAEDKNTQEFMVWIVDYDPSAVDKPLLRAKVVAYGIEEHRQNALLPQRICKTRNDSRAKRCPFRDACFSRANGGQV